jgi:hypothetical protein
MSYLCGDIIGLYISNDISNAWILGEYYLPTKPGAASGDYFSVKLKLSLSSAVSFS